MNRKSHFHCVYSLTYHLVLVTKYRRPCLSKQVRERMKNIFTELLDKWDAKLIEFNGEEDHVHLLIELNPTIQPSKLVNNLKTVSSRYIRSEFKTQMKKYYWKPVLWSRAYCLLTTGGATIDIIRKYIENQGGNSSPSK
ncbi:MAG: IS200/IS605 family transposase [Cytophagales bacterium]|nr:IS200/IS605 family transposase [Cytophagales bacterium]